MHLNEPQYDKDDGMSLSRNGGAAIEPIMDLFWNPMFDLGVEEKSPD